MLELPSMHEKGHMVGGGDEAWQAVEPFPWRVSSPPFDAGITILCRVFASTRVASNED